MTGLLDNARSRVGGLKHRLFCAEHVVRLSFTEGHNTGPVTRVTGAGPTIEAAIDNAAAKLGRKDAEQGEAA